MCFLYVWRNKGILLLPLIITRICAAEMAVRYAALSACRKVHHDNGTDGQTERQTECDAICGPLLGRRAA